jgi:hypothetical protein
LEIRKTLVRSLNDGGDKDPREKNLEKTHTVYTFAKRKRDTQKMEIQIPETQESLGEMDVDEIIREPN